MSYNVTIFWQKNLDEVFVDNKYSRLHTWGFDGGIELAASSSPLTLFSAREMFYRKLCKNENNNLANLKT
jgi:hypothetical protein